MKLSKLEKSVSNLKNEKIEFPKMGKPLYAWNIYKEYREIGFKVPDWVFEYFDDVAEKITSINMPGKETQKLLVSALGNITGDQLTLQHDEIRNQRIINSVFNYMMNNLIKTGKMKITSIYALVAKEFNLSPDRVRHIYNDYLKKENNIQDL